VNVCNTSTLIAGINIYRPKATKYLAPAHTISMGLIISHPDSKCLGQGNYCGDKYILAQGKEGNKISCLSPHNIYGADYILPRCEVSRPWHLLRKYIYIGPRAKRATKYLAPAHTIFTGLIISCSRHECRCCHGHQPIHLQQACLSMGHYAFMDVQLYLGSARPRH
jgi:hypothetical protein